MQAVPMQPMAMPMQSVAAVPMGMGLGAGVGAATYMVGRPVAGVPVASASTFQPTYGILPRM
jgi:hypothetical protein